MKSRMGSRIQNWQLGRFLKLSNYSRVHIQVHQDMGMQRIRFWPYFRHLVKQSNNNSSPFAWVHLTNKSDKDQVLSIADPNNHCSYVSDIKSCTFFAHYQNHSKCKFRTFYQRKKNSFCGFQFWDCGAVVKCINDWKGGLLGLETELWPCVAGTLWPGRAALLATCGPRGERRGVAEQHRASWSPCSHPKRPAWSRSFEASSPNNLLMFSTFQPACSPLLMFGPLAFSTLLTYCWGLWTKPAGKTFPSPTPSSRSRSNPPPFLLTLIK